MARENDVPIIVLSQLSRKIEERKGKDTRPLLSDLRDTGAIEQDADLVMFLHRTAQGDHEDTVSLNIAKHRNGRLASIPFVFAGATMDWEEMRA